MRSFAAIFLLVAAMTASQICFSKEASTSPISARRLYEACRHTIEKLEEGPEALSDAEKIHLCYFYITGAADMAASMSPSPIYSGQICVPRDYIFQDVARKVVALGVENPTLFDKDRPGSLLAYYAVKETYGQVEPCPK
jgi:hypothetical protein